MRRRLNRRLVFWLLFASATCDVGRVAVAQVREVVVGVTPTCPEGFGSCWAGIYAGLGTLEDIQFVSKSPDEYNCTTMVRLKKNGLPDLKSWHTYFELKDDRQLIVRGVEVTVDGELSKQGKKGLVCTVPGVDKPLRLAALQNKLQWNIKKGRWREPEPEEAAAFRQLRRLLENSDQSILPVQLVGPLTNTKDGPVLEVREFYPLDK